MNEEGGDGEGVGEGGDGSNVLWWIGRTESTESITFVSTSEDLKPGDRRNVTRRNTNVSSITVSASL